MDPLPTLEDLVWLLEVEPVSCHPDEDWRRDWPYACVVFTTLRDDYAVTFSLSPGYGDAGVAISRDGYELVALRLFGVKSVGVENSMRQRNSSCSSKTKSSDR